MKKITCLGMGSFRMGNLAWFLITIMVACTFIPVLGVAAEDTSAASAPAVRALPDPNTWYIYTSRIIQDNRSVEMPIIINSSGELAVKSSATLELIQKHDYQRNITVKDNGTLRLQAGKLVSNYALRVELFDNGRVIIEKGSELQVTSIVANDNSVTRISSGTLTSGIGGLVIQITGDSTLKLIEGSITNADAFKAAGNSNIELQNGTIKTKNFDINCNELKIIS
ncbi:hypothetical protein, partial [[Eubacterium] cellulosolvens]